MRMERHLLRLEFRQQAICDFVHLLVVDLIPEPLVARHSMVDFVALVAHGYMHRSKKRSSRPTLRRLFRSRQRVFVFVPLVLEKCGLVCLNEGRGTHRSTWRLRHTASIGAAPFQPYRIESPPACVSNCTLAGDSISDTSALLSRRAVQLDRSCVCHQVALARRCPFDSLAVGFEIEAMPMPKYQLCILTRSAKVPVGPDWLHEEKLDGNRPIVNRDGDREAIHPERLMTRRTGIRGS